MAVVTMTGGGWGPGAKQYQTSTNVAPKTYSYTSPAATTAMQQTRQQTPAQQQQQQTQQQPNAAQTTQQPAQRSELANYMNQYYGQKGFFAGDINKARSDFQQWQGQQPAAAPAQSGGQSALSQALGGGQQMPAPAQAPQTEYQKWLGAQSADAQAAANRTYGNDLGLFKQWANKNVPGYSTQALTDRGNIYNQMGRPQPWQNDLYQQFERASYDTAAKKAKNLGFTGQIPQFQNITPIGRR